MGVTKEELDIVDRAWEDACELSETAWKAWKKLNDRADELRDIYLNLSQQYGREESIRRREERDKK